MERRLVGDLHQIREHNHILKLRSQPDQVQRILIDRDLVGQRCRIVAAQPRPAIGVNADTKESDAGLEPGAVDNVGERGVDVVVHLRGVGSGLVVFVVERQQEDIGDNG